MRLVRTADGFLYIDEQGREISLPDISDEADEPYSAADEDEDDLYEEEAAPRPASAEEDPYGLDNAYFDPYEQIFFSQISDDLYQIASPDGGARLLFAEVDSGCGIFQLVAQLDRNGRHIRLCYNVQRTAAAAFTTAVADTSACILLHPSARQRSRLRPGRRTGRIVSEDERFYVNRLYFRHLQRQGIGALRLRRLRQFDRRLRTRRQKLRGFAYRNHIMVEHSQPDGLVSPLRIRPLRHRRQSAQEQQQPRRRMDVRLPQRPYRRYRRIGEDGSVRFRRNRELVYRIDADGQRSDSERDDYGRITVERDPLGRETRYLYDTEGNVIAITAPDGSSTQIDYHETLNLPVAVNDPAGRDYRLRLRQTRQPHQHHRPRRLHYQLTATTPNGCPKPLPTPWQNPTPTLRHPRPARLLYRLYRRNHPFRLHRIRRSRNRYRCAGPYHPPPLRRSRQPRPYRLSRRQSRNLRIRPPQPSDRPHRRTWRQNRLRTRVDGLPLKRTNALGHTFAYAYDKARRLTVLTNENGETYRLDYDPTDNLIQETGWDGKITAYGYDAAGQLVQQTEYGQSNNEGRLKDRPETWHIHHFKRNILGQLDRKQSRKYPTKTGKAKTTASAAPVSTTIPITGNLTKARNHHSSVELAYDELDRLIGETTVHNGQSATVGYQYDPLGNRIRTIPPDGRHIDYLYYGSGHLHQISLDGEVVSDIERDKLHREIQRTQGSISSLTTTTPWVV